MQTASSTILTLVDVSFSYDGKQYTYFMMPVEMQSVN